MKAVELHIYEKLHLSPAEQLMYESIELIEGDETLGKYGEPRDAVVRLDIISSLWMANGETSSRFTWNEGLSPP